MAYMFPEKPKECAPNSREDIMFSALSRLPDDYYVFHSFSVVQVVDGVVYESETDFVIFCPDKGLICLEAKAGQVRYENGCWRYGDGRPMSHDGPFNQAAGNKWKLRKYIEELKLSYLLDKCKMLHAVWFPSVGMEHFKGVSLPSEADRNLMLTREAFDNITESIDRIFAIKLPNAVENKMSQKDVKEMINCVLAPSFNLISIPELKLDHKRMVFKQMLKEQVALLNYLEEQNCAVINGLAGTGKTIMAVKKAQMDSEKKERVLFLCYNIFLKNYLQENYNDPNIDYFTIDGLACKLCDTKTADYGRLKDVLTEMYMDETFPYRHIVIDEGQDFGRTDISETDIIDLLKSNVMDDESKAGSFYLFYDRNQMVQANALPSYIEEADCRLTLYRNCRNTENIAITSMRLLGSGKEPKLFDGAVAGDSPEMYFATDTESTVKTLNHILSEYLDNKYDNIQILTCKTEDSSIIAGECSTGVYLYKGKKIPFTTCRKYKGLESDAVIMVDMEKKIFEDNCEQIMYVGSSRARYKLAMIAQMDEEGCGELLAGRANKKTRTPYKAFASLFNAKYVNGIDIRDSYL